MDQPLPALTLVDQRGRSVSLAGLGERPTLVTFAFGHCATVCPVIVSDLRAARRSAGRSDVQLVVVTLDPWRDTPDRLAGLAAHWALEPADLVLSGSIAVVARALDALGVARRRDELTGDMDHATAVLIVESRGRVAWRVDGGSAGVAAALARLSEPTSSPSGHPES